MSLITVIGSINLDLAASVARLPGPGETVPGTGFNSTPGGKGANQALAAARASARVRMVGAVGRDAFAGEALALLEKGGIDLSRVEETEEPTGTALILVDREGENQIAVVPGANATVGPQQVARLPLQEDEFVLLQQEVPVEAIAAALTAAREAGAISLLNTAPYRDDATQLLPLADIVVANETEFDLCATRYGIRSAKRSERIADLAKQIRGTVVVTLGAEGVVAATPDETFAVPARPIQPVDTVGAGDTFCGTLAATLSAGIALEPAIRRASTAATLACLKPGAQASMPTAREVDSAMLDCA